MAMLCNLHVNSKNYQLAFLCFPVPMNYRFNSLIIEILPRDSSVSFRSLPFLYQYRYAYKFKSILKQMIMLPADESLISSLSVLYNIAATLTERSF